MKLYITKYALTAGIQERDGHVCASHPDMVDCGHGQYFHGNDWHIDRAAAIARAEVMRKKKIDSLKKSLRKMETLQFAP